MCLRTILRKYYTGRYAPGTDIMMHLRIFVLIAYICGFRKDRQMVQYNKDQRIDQKHHDLFQCARNAQNIIRYDNEFKVIYLLRE